MLFTEEKIMYEDMCLPLKIYLCIKFLAIEIVIVNLMRFEAFNELLRYISLFSIIQRFLTAFFFSHAMFCFDRTIHLLTRRPIRDKMSQVAFITS